jgi:DNA-directed DNA polymerase
MNKLVLIDGHSILNRAFYGLPVLTNSKGQYTNAVYGFLNIMFKILDEEKANYLAVAFDLSAPTFRHLEYEEYKGTRKSMPEELREQVPLIKEVLASMNIPILTKEGFEADDILGTIAKRFANETLEVSIVSGDRDLLQLSDTHIKIRIPKSSKGQTIIKDYYPTNVKEEYGVTPLEFIDLKALMGDASDNIPGVPSIGKKTATNIIKEYHSIESAYKDVDNIKPPRAAKALKEHYDMAVFSKFLATIKIDVPLELSLDEMLIKDMENKESFELINNLEFKSLLKRFDLNDIKTDLKFEYEYIADKNIAFSIVDSIKEETNIALDYIYISTKDPFTNDTKKNIKAFSISLASDKAFIISLNDSENLELVKLLLDKNISLFTLDLKTLVKLTQTSYKNNLYDLGIAAYLINPLKDSYNSEDIARDFIDLSIPTKEDILAKKDFATEIKANNTGILEYFAKRSIILFKSKDIILSKLKESSMYDLYINIEMPLVFSLAKMEKNGIGIDANRLHEYSLELLAGIDKIEKEIYQETGEQFNINSPKQLGEVLFEKLGLKGGKKTKTGYSTAADVLEKLAPEYPVVNKILEYRQLTKLNSTYAQGLSSYIESDGRIHGTFNQTVTATGRISSTEPNLQNIPIRTSLGSKIRDVFVPNKGYSFVDADYSQIELRVLASMAEDEKLIESYKSGKDIHAITASQVFGVPLDKVTPNLRRNAKAVNFGVVYGISAFGLSEDLSISRNEAKDYINNYFKTYPKVKKFLDRQVKDAKEKGFVKTLYSRIRPIPEIKSSNFMQRAFGDRIAMNSPIQGSAADIMKLAMLKVDKALEESDYDARIVLQVHDELLVEVADKDREAVRLLVEDSMKTAAKLEVSLEVDAHIGKTWLSAKE